jgi:hypothetical protein
MPKISNALIKSLIVPKSTKTKLYGITKHTNTNNVFSNHSSLTLTKNYSKEKSKETAVLLQKEDTIIANQPDEQNKYRGVIKCKDGYKVQLTVSKKRYTYGPFKTAREAGLKYDERAKAFFGSRANLNFDDGKTDTKKKNRKVMTGIIQRNVASEQKWICNFCNGILDSNYQIDHAVPLFLNGNDDINNLQALCSVCHKFKSESIDRQILAKIINDGRCLDRSIVILIQKLMINKIKPSSSDKVDESIVDSVYSDYISNVKDKPISGGNLTERGKPISGGNLTERGKPISGGNLTERGKPISGGNLTERGKPISGGNLTERGKPISGGNLTERGKPISGGNLTERGKPKDNEKDTEKKEDTDKMDLDTDIKIDVGRYNITISKK